MRKRGRETSMCERYSDWLPLTRPQLGTWSTAQACALTGNQTRSVLNPMSRISQGKTECLVREWAPCCRELKREQKAK